MLPRVDERDRFDRIWRVAYPVVMGVTCAGLMRIARDWPWIPALSLGVTVGAVTALVGRVLGPPSQYMGTPAPGRPFTMPPAREVAVLAGGLSCSLGARLSDGPVREALVVLTVGAAVTLLVLVRTRRR